MKFCPSVQISEQMGEEKKDSLAHSHLTPEIFPKYWQLKLYSVFEKERYVWELWD